MRDRRSDQHRTLTEAELGRTLGPDEVVDHVNEDKADNSRLNRRLMTRRHHTTMHNQTRNLSRLRRSLRMVKERRKLY